MLTPVVCFTCGMPTIGDVAVIYRKMCAERTRKALEKESVIVRKAATTPSVDTQVGDILDDLGVEAECCRTRLMTAVVFSDAVDA